VKTPEQGPEDGHTFRFTMASRTSANVEGEPKSDSGWWGDPSRVEVRAWNLRDALAKAQALPLSAWVPADDVVTPPEQEFAVRCPDGYVWGGRYRNDEVASRYAVEGDAVCGCEQSGHRAVTRMLPDWTPVSPS
jgi:hypothetical protein